MRKGGALGGSGEGDSNLEAIRIRPAQGTSFGATRNFYFNVHTEISAQNLLAKKFATKNPSFSNSVVAE
ncbi:MAG: hypothetical protein WCA89_09935 [Terracidiphilus sp.]|jgi:hypothetical protein